MTQDPNERGSKPGFLNAAEAWARLSPCSGETSNSWSMATTQARTVLGATPTLRAASAPLVGRPSANGE